jgi:hypothetical protein
VALLLADTDMDYTSGAQVVSAGQIVEAQGFRYEVAASDASDAHVETAGGVKLYVAEDVVRPDMFGAMAGAATSQSSYFQKMFDAGVVDIYLPAGVWRCDTTVTCDHDIRLTGPGTLDFSNGNAQLLIVGSLAPLSAMSANVAKHGQTLQWSSSQGLAARDIIMGYNPTDFSWGSRRAEYRDGFMFRVHSMDGNNARVYGLAVDAYAAANFDMYKMVAPRVVIEGPTFIAGTGALAAVSCKNCQDVVIRNIKATGGQGQLVEVNQCFGADIDCTTALNNSPFLNDEYGIIISNSHNVSVRGGNPAATRHPVAIGGYGVTGSIPNRYINISGMCLQNSPGSNAVSAADAHGNSDFVSYDNCMMIGTPGGGRNISIRNCTIFGQYGNNPAVSAPELVGGFFSLENCTIMTESDCQTSGAILIQPHGSGGFGYPAGTNMREDLHVILRNVTVIAPNAGSLAKMLVVQSSNANKKTNVTIDGVVVQAPNLLAFLVASDNTLATFLADFFVVDNVMGPTGAYIIFPSTHIPTIPTREMKQMGVQAITTAASTVNAAAGDMDFRYKYSRIPVAVTGVSLASYAASGTTAGQSASTKVYALSATNIRTAITAPVAFTAGTDVLVHWNVGVMGI